MSPVSHKKGERERMWAKTEEYPVEGEKHRRWRGEGRAVGEVREIRGQALIL